MDNMYFYRNSKIIKAINLGVSQYLSEWKILSAPIIREYLQNISLVTITEEALFDENLPQYLKTGRDRKPGKIDPSNNLTKGLTYTVPGLNLSLKLLYTDLAERPNSVVFKARPDSVGNLGVFLSEEDCKVLGIRFEEGLIIYPRSFNWISTRRVPNKMEESSDLLNYLEIRGRDYLEYAIVSVDFFISSVTAENIVSLRNGRFLDLELFLISLKVELDLGFEELQRFKGECLSWSIIYENFGNSVRDKNSTICDKSGKLNLIIDFTKGGQGIPKNLLEGVEIGDLIKISYIDSFSSRLNKFGDVVRVYEPASELTYFSPKRTNYFKKINNRYWKTND